MSSKFKRLIDDTNNEQGVGSASLGSSEYAQEYIPSGSLALDLALGGGWPVKHLHGVFGKKDIGKSSMIGLQAIASAQALGKNCVLIAVEPSFDPTWASRHGVNVDELLIIRPTTGERAFDALFKCVTSTDPHIGLIVFDSIGALLTETEIFGKEGGDGKAKVGGQSGLITHGIKRCVPFVWRNNCCVILINQVRANMSSPYGGEEQPGGYALEHSESIIVHLRFGADKYIEKIQGDPVEIGRQVVATVRRNKTNEGTGRKAIFDFYNKEVEGKPFGIDKIKDVLATGVKVGIIEQKGAYYYLPGIEKGILGKDGVATYLKENPSEYERIRTLVLEKGKN